ncbi:hypothetical protein [Paenibacillus sp. MSJ-34]|uniref:hypothetical protein n=1 Tax=Paenibacillus sp. MSJ-34 TaxID=2841529 RepID=UPI001C103755|nr:hypothetical protein [Paenibacillus sp. MSJ-34]MBU5442684.1 hypothetical protein [Paenibacillus sp. MSJ-34]
MTHSAPEERAIVRFKDGSAQLYKNDPIVFAHDLSDEQDFKIMLSWWMTYVEAQKAGVEADDTEINRSVVNQYLDNTNVNIDQLQGPELKIAVADFMDRIYRKYEHEIIIHK